MADKKALVGDLPEIEGTVEGDDVGANEEIQAQDGEIQTVEVNITPSGPQPLSVEMRAMQAELELLGPLWTTTLMVENPEASQDQIDAILAGKLQSAYRLMPGRWEAESRFKDDCRIVEHAHVKLTKIMDDIKAKNLDDKTARIENFKAERIIDDWIKVRRPALEKSYFTASSLWYKPKEDPLTNDLNTSTDKIEDLIALFKYEQSLRSILQEDARVAHSSEEPSANLKAKKNIIQFDAAKLISSFSGDPEDPDVLLHFSNWKSSWDNLLKEMETLRGFSPTTLFQKLKDCLSGQALDMISKYSTRSNNSYEAAMASLIEKYEDPITLAGSYISSGIRPRNSDAEHADAIQQSFNALHNMRDIFDREGVDMHDFALMRTFIVSMSPKMQAKWNAYKMEKKLEHNLQCEAGLKNGETLPEWKAGNVERREQFNAWLSLQKVQFRPPVDSETKEEKKSTASNFAFTKTSGKTKGHESIGDCFLCPDKPSHAVAKCRKGLMMTYYEWKQACTTSSRCFLCAGPYSPSHKCNRDCWICRGRHHPVMCPDNRDTGRPSRSTSSSRERDSSSSRDPSRFKFRDRGSKPNTKRGSEEHQELSDAPMAKLAKHIVRTMSAQFNEKENNQKGNRSGQRGARNKS